MADQAGGVTELAGGARRPRRGAGTQRVRATGAGTAGGPGPTQLIFAALVLAGYCVLVGFLAAHRADLNWDRLVFLFSGVEAIVFAAAGMVFGTAVQRSQVQTARADTAAARAEAQAGTEAAVTLDNVVALIRSRAAEERAAQPAGSAQGVPPEAYGARGASSTVAATAMADLERAVLAMVEGRS
ncbi:hypothetical protein [Kitasatospora sp. NPDC094015]|uniref:hypothetical protein n=1 Tax=Kitasatospora sp. NPDC094015 TaxID=3155205 RepID=UPI003329B41D